jgi:hypothetical protein
MDILTFETSQVLLNSIPGKPFKCNKRVRQGILYPLYSLSWLLISCNQYLTKLLERIFLSTPSVKIILPAEAPQLYLLKGMLRSFTDSTGLRVNYSKSFLVPINISEERTQYLAKIIGCSVTAMPFTYLGLPLGTTRPSVEDFLPFLQRIEKRLMSLNKMLSYQGRLILVNSILTALPTFYMCSLKIPSTSWCKMTNTGNTTSRIEMLTEEVVDW